MGSKPCFVPSCSKNMSDNPDLLFVPIPERVREDWCRQVKAEYFKNCLMYCCEDHLNPEDIRNYMKCKIMNELPKMAPTAQLRHITPPLPVPKKSSVLCQLLLQNEDIPAAKSKKQKIDHNTLLSTTASILRSQGDAATQSDKNVHHDNGTNKHYKNQKLNQTPRSSTSLWDEEVSVKEPSNPSIRIVSSESEDTVISAFNLRNMFLELIFKKPNMYLGLPRQYKWLINYIVQKSSVKTTDLCLIVTLFKIKQNVQLDIMCDQFEITLPKLKTFIHQGIQILANFFQNFIYLPSVPQISNLPLVFKGNVSNVQIIIDCFEIKIEKPREPLKQSQTWSQYRNCNTLKYLIGYTPNGFVNFISKGYGGRLSDKALLEKSRLIERLPVNAVILADKGFKKIESVLESKNIKLIRGHKLSQEDLSKSNNIASLRSHIESVIRKIREFKILNSVVHRKHVAYLDQILLIACGLINLQNDMIKIS